MRKRKSTTVQRGWTVRCSRREKIKWKWCSWDQVKWSGCVRVGERLTYGQSVARAYYHRGGKGKGRRERKRKGRKLQIWRESRQEVNGQQRMYGSCGVERRDPWVLREMTDGQHSARDHTHSLLHLKYLISVSFREHWWQCLKLSLLTKGHSVGWPGFLEGKSSYANLNGITPLLSVTYSKHA